MYPRRLCSCDQVPASGPMYVHAGLEGSVIALTNVLGELVERYRYTAFGLLTVLDAEGEEKDSPALSPWLYHGRLYENESGLYWMRMRHYSPDLGRFLQPDPAGIAGGINLYAYSNNNPLRYFDPWGLWPAPDASGGDDGEYGEADPSREARSNNLAGQIGAGPPTPSSSGEVKQVLLWGKFPRKANGVIQQAVRITATKDGVTEVVAERTEAWLVEKGIVYSINNGVKSASTGDTYIMRRHDPAYPDSVTWTGNMVFFPGQEIDGSWGSSSSSSDVSKGMLYQEGLLFDLSDPGVHRVFTIENNRTDGRWDIVTDTIQTVTGGS